MKHKRSKKKGTHCSDGIYMHPEENRVAKCEAFETGSISATTMIIKQTSHRYYGWETVNLHTVLHRCEIWSFQIMEGHGLRAFGSKVLRRIFGSKKEAETGGCRKPHNKELHNLG
jgi:hypothetical protein